VFVGTFVRVEKSLCWVEAIVKKVAISVFARAVFVRAVFVRAT
jgi:hypothetical protein